MRSAKESNSTPKRLHVFVSLATLPSSPSNIRAKTMSQEATVNSPLIEFIILTTPAKILEAVKIFGSI